MHVYLPHKNSNHTMFVCPAGDPAMKGEMPSDWVDDDNKPLTFPVKFEHGKAAVDDKLGKYMVERGLARKSPIIHPKDLN